MKLIKLSNHRVGENMLHDLKLYSENFDRMKLGLKTREYRLYDEKRRLISEGDTI